MSLEYVVKFPRNFLSSAQLAFDLFSRSTLSTFKSNQEVQLRDTESTHEWKYDARVFYTGDDTLLLELAAATLSILTELDRVFSQFDCFISEDGDESYQTTTSFINDHRSRITQCLQTQTINNITPNGNSASTSSIHMVNRNRLNSRRQ